ncbi:MAG: FkbM family methyltransferase [Simkaniaceae bacterium]|nr:FkbM family methyltransferase [Simkaniaceae bacterium]
MSRLIVLLFTFTSLFSKNIVGEGVFPNRNPETWRVSFLPYNATVVAADCYNGEHIQKLAKALPHGKIYYFNPFSQIDFSALDCVEHINKTVGITEGRMVLYQLLCPSIFKDNKIFSQLTSQYISPHSRILQKVPVECVNIKKWVSERNCKKIHLLRLHTYGNELNILKSISDLAKRCIVVSVTTGAATTKMSRQHEQLKRYMGSLGFVLLMHQRERNGVGVAYFLHQTFYRGAYERKSL